MPRQLDGAYLKIERARSHLQSLEDAVRIYSESSPYRYLTERDPQSGDLIIRIKQLVDTPVYLGLIAGDVAHNLRSALDHLVFELAIPPGGTGDGETTAWPTYADQETYRSQERRLLAGVGDRQRARIEALQPYHAREALTAGSTLEDAGPWRTHLYLSAIGRLDNLDKHRLILPTVSIAKFVQPTFSGVRTAKGKYPGDYVLVKDGAELFRITEMELLETAADVKMTSRPSFGIGFGTPDFSGGEEWWTDRTKVIMGVGDLHRAAGIVEEVVHSFAEDFPA